MKTAVILSFSERGSETAKRIREAMESDWECIVYSRVTGLHETVRQYFHNSDAMIFVGACGIAVRAIASFVASKKTDPAVIVIDEKAQFVISLLSGHIGGANRLANMIAVKLDSIPVITTATDINGKFAVDEWAARNHVYIDSMAEAKRFAADILKHDVPIYSAFPLRGNLPGGVYSADSGDFGAVISCVESKIYDEQLNLYPQIVHLGIGCKRNTPVEKIRDAVRNTLSDNRIHPRSIVSVSSIDVKQDEKGLLEYCNENGYTVNFYSAEELMSVEGYFNSSDFVRNTVGVDNVCERAAMLTAGDGAKLIIHKTCADGVTVAAAIEKWSVCFE